MWCWKYTIIFICIWCIYRVHGTKKIKCDYNYHGYTFNQTEVGDPPVNTPIIELNQPIPTEPPYLKIELTNRTDDFNFTLFFYPVMNKQSPLQETDCPSGLNETQDLRQYKKTCPVFKDADESIPQIFRYIYTGCYYIIVTNAKGNNWEWGPFVPNSTHRYLDTQLKYITRNFDPPERNVSRRLRAELVIPLSCIKVNVQLSQIDGNVDAIDDIKKSKIQGSQECWIAKNDSTVAFHCDRSELSTKLGLEVRLSKVNGEEWTIVTTWTELQDAGGTYYLQLASFTDVCETRYGYDAINTWKPIPRNILVQLGFQNPIPTLLPPKQLDTVYYISIIILLVCVSLSITVIVVLACKRKRDYKDLQQTPPSSEIFCEGDTIEKLPSEKESDHILLMYARDSSRFNRLMEEFRTALAKTCDCHVYDLYAKEDWKHIMHLGAARWLAKQLEDGCRIIWVDTLRLRLKLNNQQYQDTTGDFRDRAVSYGVKLATGLYVNATTQYRRHFVVRMEGFEAMDGHVDPFLVVSPFTRFCIPRHISHLYRELRESMQVVVRPTE